MMDRQKHPRVAEDDAIQKKKESKYAAQTKKLEMAKKMKKLPVKDNSMKHLPVKDHN